MKIMPYSDIKELINKAKDAEQRKEYELAEKLWKEVEKHFRQKNKIKKADYFKALAIECLAKNLKQKEKLKEAADKIKKAAEIWKSINQTRNYTWCIANYHSWMGNYLMKNGEYKDASEHFKEAKIFFEKIEDTKSVIYCEAYMYRCLALLKRLERNYKESSYLFFIASEKFRSVNLILQSLQCEMNAWGCLGHDEMSNRNFPEAKKYFLLASAFAEVLGKDSIKSWYKAKYYECEYRFIKSTKDGPSKLPEIIEILEKVVECYEKSNDEVGLYVAKGDLSKYKGFKSKVNNKLDEAIKYFNDAKSYYEEAAKLDTKNSKRHESSAIYASALAIETEAHKAYLNFNFKEAAEKFRVASEKYAQCEAYENAETLSYLCKICQALSEGDLTIAYEILNKFGPDIPISGPLRDYLQVIKALAPIIQKHTSRLIDFDKGPSFEARVRDLVRYFDNREIDGSKFGIYPPDKIKLKRYDDVRTVSFKPEPDEIGIVFNDETPIDIDVLAYRKERNRTYILIAECKHRPKYKVSIKDLELLLKKSKFIKRRYSKIAKLQNEFEPIVEEIWFVTTGEFTENTKNFATCNNIRLIDINALNNLFKEFGLPRMKY